MSSKLTKLGGDILNVYSRQDSVDENRDKEVPWESRDNESACESLCKTEEAPEKSPRKRMREMRLENSVEKRMRQCSPRHV